MSDTETQTEATSTGTGAEAAAQDKKPQTLGQVAAEILWLMTRTPTHRHFFIADAEWLIFPPISNAQFRIYRDKDMAPAGCVLWASLSDEVQQRVEAGATRLAPADWKSGDNLWIIDVVAPNGKATAMVEDMRNTVFKGKAFKFHATGQDGKRTVQQVEPKTEEEAAAEDAATDQTAST